MPFEKTTDQKLQSVIHACAKATFIAAMAALAGCAGTNQANLTAAQNAPGAQRCTAMTGAKIAAARIGASNQLASGDATVTSARLVAPAPLQMDSTGKGVKTPATPEYCRIDGSIAATTPGAQPIGFQVNLPTQWNTKMVQMGGGGLNGVLPPATGYISINNNAGSYDAPLNRGYITASTDSGHLTAASPLNTAKDPSVKAGALHDFGLNDEMLRNFAHESYKKVHDVAVELSTAYYGKAPTRKYYFGGSEGGREALTMAQRYPADFDGIFARSPVINWTGLFTAFIFTGQNQLRNNNAAHIGKKDIALLYQSVLAACDGKDGIVDGVVGDYLGCKPYADPAIQAKRCTAAYRPGVCFTREQLSGIQLVYSPTTTGFVRANGIATYPGWLYGGEAASFGRWKTGAKGAGFGDEGMSVNVYYGFGVAKYFFAQDGNVDVVRDYSPQKYQQRIQYVSSLMDSTNPDLTAFHARGGKAIMVDCTADWAKSAQTSFDYYDSVVKRMGRQATNDFLRLYVSPSTDHGCASTINTASISTDGTTLDGAKTSPGTVKGIPVNVDWVSVMESWVEKNQAPGQSVVATRNDPTPPFTATAAKPVCHYPLYPKYTGDNPTLAASYTCTVSGI